MSSNMLNCKKTFTLFLSALMCTLFVSCSSTSKIAYFQDHDSAGQISMAQAQNIRFQPGDKISILVKPQGPAASDFTNMFNKYSPGNYIGSKTSSGYGYLVGYLLDVEGNIDFPVLGNVHIGGMTRSECEQFIKNSLIASGQVKEVSVVVDYMNLNVSVFGEVASPGNYSFSQDQITVLDALCRAGDLKITGRREDIQVIRNENGVQKTFTVNLCSMDELMSSEAFYLKQGDLVYVQPNKMRQRQSTLNSNTVFTTSFWVSLGSLGLSIARLVMD